MSNEEQTPANRLRKELPEEMPAGANEAVDKAPEAADGAEGRRPTRPVGSGS